MSRSGKLASSTLPLSRSFIDPADIAPEPSYASTYQTINQHHDSIEAHMYYNSQEDEAAGGPSTGRATNMNGLGYQPVSSPDLDGSPPSASPSVQGGHMYGSWTGYCFTVNYILGVGVLGMPYAFYRGGWLLSSLCLGFVTIMATYTALWLVDVSLRAQYLKRQGHLLRPTTSSSVGSGLGGHSNLSVSEITQPVSPTNHHRYEMNELTEMFLGLNARRFYELLVIFYLVGALWSYSSVFSSSLASRVGMPGLNGGDTCDIYNDSSQECSDLYLTFMGIFAVIAIPLTCLDLTEMKLLQIALAIFRFVSLATMMVTSLIAMYSYPNPNPDAHSSPSSPYTSDVKAFDWSNLGLVFPIAIYAQIFHHSVPGLSHPLKNKRSAPRVFTGVLVTTMVLYSALGIVVSMYYGGSIQQTCTIAWASYTGSGDPTKKPKWASFISYLVVLFPPIDIISAFPLNAITLGNNLLCTFVTDERKQSLKRYKIPFRLLAACPPIVGSMIVKDLGVILKYTGCVGVLIAFIYPSILAWASKKKCEALGIAVQVEDEHDDRDLLGRGNGRQGGFGIGGKASIPVHVTTPTYNGTWINHPAAIWIVMAFSIVGLISVIVLSIAGLSN